MTFNPDLFVAAQTDEASSTQYTPIPEGEYSARVDKVAAREPKPGMAMLDVTWILNDEGVRELTGLEEPRVRQSVFLDIDEAGQLEMGKGKNVSLGRLRQALNQNTPGVAWAPNNLIGAAAVILVTQRIVTEDRDGNALPEHEHRTFNDVRGVMAA